MRHFWVIALISIALSSKINAMSVPSAVDPFDHKCASFAMTNDNWNFQIPVNLTLIPSLSFISFNTDIEREHAEWVEKTWEATKGNSSSWGTLQPGITLVKGFSLSNEDIANPFLVMIEEDGIVQSGYAKRSSKSDLCSMAMRAADKTIVTLDSFDNMFQPIDEDLANKIRVNAEDLPSFMLAGLKWICIAITIATIIMSISSILKCAAVCVKRNFPNCR